MKKLFAAWLVGMMALGGAILWQSGRVDGFGQPSAVAYCPVGGMAFAASAESPVIPSFMLKSFASEAQLEAQVGEAYVPSERDDGTPLVTLERWPEGSTHPSTLVLPGFGVSWVQGSGGTAVLFWGNTETRHAVVTVDFSPEEEEEAPCAGPQASRQSQRPAAQEVSITRLSPSPDRVYIAASAVGSIAARGALAYVVARHLVQ